MAARVFLKELCIRLPKAAWPASRYSPWGLCWVWPLRLGPSASAENIWWSRAEKPGVPGLSSHLVEGVSKDSSGHVQPIQPPGAPGSDPRQHLPSEMVRNSTAESLCRVRPLPQDPYQSTGGFRGSQSPCTTRWPTGSRTSATETNQGCRAGTLPQTANC